ncbi:DUF2179 domain-containing protein [Methanoregula formicica]|uniref:UPF0316 protein Metfor_2749 n=1 Tax=Methanoregula formicica (strain DSM 22288 / NBRC 105244 / SMSP) TaxID=593750 RepID=L0HL02_METFS|nr:DUF5698 domain-containing protein [Methanoregula formicica]AGB03734.1 hypothetical protein Metfor_2749 [Methanoregula formicica SMSP]
MALFIISPELYAWVILPLLIFLARVCDVTMETVRIVFISKGIRLLATVIAFFEIVIWLLAAGVVMNDLANIANFLAFALGFAMGTYVGLVVEERLSLGMVILRIVTADESRDAIVSSLQSENHGVTCIEAEGSRGSVTMILSLVQRSEISRITGRIDRINPKAFFSIEDVRYVNEGVFRPRDFRSFLGMVHTLAGQGRKK